MNAIPGASHYQSAYLGPELERLSSYRQQLLYAKLSPAATEILVVGSGDSFVPHVLADQGIKVTTLDIQPELNPSVVGSVERIPFPDNSFDLVMCCQVLEHIPFSQVNVAIGELARVAKRRVIISVPDVRRFAALQLKASRFSASLQLSIPRLRPVSIPRSRFDEMGHHWEIGYAGTPYRKFAQLCRRPGWNIAISKRVFDLPWHLFIILER